MLQTGRNTTQAKVSV